MPMCIASFYYAHNRKHKYSQSKVLFIGDYEGLCHVFVDKDADLKMAIKVVKNSKMRNVSICGAAETLLIDKRCMKTHCQPILNELVKLKCKIIGDKKVKKNFSKKIKIAKKMQMHCQKNFLTDFLFP